MREKSFPRRSRRGVTRPVRQGRRTSNGNYRQSLGILGELRGRIRRFIEIHLSDPTLRPEEIALAFQISVRHLHRLFSVTGNTLAAYIRARRLEECRSDLANPRLQDHTITDLAFFWGFSDSAHFSHSFTKEFGVSPREFRARAASSEGQSNPYGRVRDLLRADTPEGRCTNPN